MANHYDVLGVDKSSTDQEIRHAYQKMALQLHPDKQSSVNVAESSITFTRISEAWRILSNNELRKEYDAQLSAEVTATNLPINEEVVLSEMIYDHDEDIYTKRCRCGGEYILSKEDVSDEDCVIFCDTCSLCIKVIISSKLSAVCK